MMRATIISSVWLLLLFVYYVSVGGAVALSLLFVSVVFIVHSNWSLQRTAKKLNCTLSGERQAVKHDKTSVSLSLQGGHPLKPLTAKIQLIVTHVATNTEQLHVVETAVSERMIVVPLELQLHHCGQYEISVKKIELLDMWQLFSKQVLGMSRCTVIVKPLGQQANVLANIVLQQQGQQQNVTQRLHDDGEDRAQLKLYSPGDQVKKIHWKLSSKLDELYVQQFSEPQQRELVISVDGTSMQQNIAVYDAVLEKTAALLKQALQGECVKFVHVQQELLVTNETELANALQQILQLTAQQLTLSSTEQQRLREQYGDVYIVQQENSDSAIFDERVRSEGA